MAIRMIEDAGWCDGVRLQQGAVVTLSPTAEADFIAIGLAEPVDEPRQEAVEEAAEESRPDAVEEAVVSAPENAARRIKRRR